MVKRNFLTKMLLLFALVVGSVSSVWGQNRTFNLVTDVSQLEADANYLIASGTNGSLYVLGGKNNNNNRKAVSATATNGIITLSAESIATDETADKVHVISLKASDTNWNIYDIAIGKYLNGGYGKTQGASSNSNHLVETDNPNSGSGKVKSGVFTISINSTTRVALISNENRRRIKLNGELFATYESGQTDVYLYKEVIDESGKTKIATIGDLTPTSININATGVFTLPITIAEATPALEANTDYEITWASSDDVVLLVNDGEYSANATGSVTITVTVTPLDDETYDEVSKEFTVTVVDPNAPGTENNPYTVTAALAADPAEGVYVQGTISSITELSTEYGNATYNISDGTNEIIVYRGKYLNNEAFTSTDQIGVGDVVKVFGNLSQYQETNQMAQGNYIVSLTRKELASISLSGSYPTEFVEGDEFNHEGIIVTATYSDQTTADVTAQATFSEPDMAQTGEQTIEVTYNGKTATYTITITALPTHTVTFSVNGSETSGDFKEGAEIVFPLVDDKLGMKCVGWSTSEITGEQATAPTNLITAANMGNADVTYYAVFAVVGECNYVKQTNGTVNGEYLIVYEGNDTHASVAFKGSLNTFDAANNGIDVTISNGTIASSADIDANIFTIDSNTGYIMGASGKYIGQSSYANGLTTNETGVTNSFSFDNSGNAVIGITFSGSTVTLRYNYASDNLRFRYYKSGQQPVALYKKTFSASNYCTTIPTDVTVTIANSGYTTLSSAHGLDFANATSDASDALVAYIIPSNDGVKLTKTEVTEAAAGTGILLKGTPSATYTIPVKADAAAVGTNLLKAGPKVVEEGNTTIYLLKSGKFHLASAGTTSVGKAYLELPEAVGAPALSIDGDDDTTGIQNIERTINDNQYYTLDGRRVAQPTKGLYIVNGKKVLVP